MEHSITNSSLNDSNAKWVTHSEIGTCETLRNIIEFTNETNIDVYPQLPCSCYSGGGDDNTNNQHNESGQNDSGNINDNDYTSANAEVRKEDAGDNSRQHNMGAQVVDGNSS